MSKKKKNKNKLVHVKNKKVDVYFISSDVKPETDIRDINWWKALDTTFLKKN